MLDENMVLPYEEATEYKPLPEDVYTVQLLDVTSKELESYDSKKARLATPALAPVMETKLSFQFVLLEGKDGDEDLRGRNVFENFVPTSLYISSKGKNTLYQIVEALQGATVTPEQEAFGITGKDVNAFIGKQCRVGTVNSPSKDGTKIYSNIDKFLYVKEKFAELTAEEKETATIKPKEATA